MAHLVCWTFSEIPSEMIDILVKDLEKYDESIKKSVVRDELRAEKDIRKSKNAWVYSNTWVGGFIWYYINRANRENFMYDIMDIDSGTIQYTEYERGEYYNWHVDDDLDRCLMNGNVLSSSDNHGETISTLNGEYVRKLSFSIQLSDPEDYEGGELEFIGGDDKPFAAPKQKGTIIIFDSRTKHRVCEVKSGIRKSLVGWIVGPRWR